MNRNNDTGCTILENMTFKKYYTGAGIIKCDARTQMPPKSRKTDA